MINFVFAGRLLALALALGAIQLLLAFTLLRALPWVLLAEAFVVGALVLHKRSTSMPWLNATPESPLRVFLKSFFVYAVPAGVLWTIFVIGVFQAYLPHTRLRPTPIWATLLTTTGVVALCAAMVGDELSRLGRSPR